MSETVVEHVLGRLKSIGIDHIFGVPGDYAFPVEDAIMNFPGIEWVGCCNELNAAYAADGLIVQTGNSSCLDISNYNPVITYKHRSCIFDSKFPYGKFW